MIQKMLGRSSWGGPHEGPLRLGGSLFTHRQPPCGSAAGGGPALQPTRSHSGIHWWSLLSLCFRITKTAPTPTPLLSTLWSWASFLRRNDRNSIHFQITLWMSEGAECSPNVNSCGSIIEQQSLPPASLSAPCPLLARFHLFHSTWFFVSGGVRHF